MHSQESSNHKTPKERIVKTTSQSFQQSQKMIHNIKHNKISKMHLKNSYANVLKHSNHRTTHKQNTLKERQNEICLFSPFINRKCLENNCTLHKCCSPLTLCAYTNLLSIGTQSLLTNHTAMLQTQNAD